MEEKKAVRGGVTQGIAIRTKKVAVNPMDKPLIETYRSLLDNPTTREAAIDALELLKSLDRQLCS